LFFAAEAFVVRREIFNRAALVRDDFSARPANVEALAASMPTEYAAA
jgi:hypothetical protein